MGLQSLVLLLCAVRGAEPKNASLALARSAPLPQRLAAGRRRLSDQYAQIAKLAASDGAIVDRFGYSVAIDGDTVVVGAIDNDDGGSESGAAYVFGTTDGWDTHIELKLMAADAAANDNFGYSVAINGNTVVVGAIQSLNAGSGVAYVFRMSDGGATYNEVAKLTASDATSGYQFGFYVAIDGDTVVVGTVRNCVYVFRTTDGGATYGQVAKLTADDGGAFGRSVAIDGDTVVIGAYQDDDGGSYSGAAYVFRTTDGGATYGQVAKLTADDAAAGDAFGYSVAIAGDTVVVSAYWSDDAGLYSGSAYVFRTSEDSATYDQVAKLTASDAAASDQFGNSVAIDGNTIVIGAYGHQQGAVYVFRARPRARGRPTRVSTRRSGCSRRATTCSRSTRARTGPPWTPSTWHHPAPRYCKTTVQRADFLTKALPVGAFRAAAAFVYPDYEFAKL
jgi:hypothetical protein